MEIAFMERIFRIIILLMLGFFTAGCTFMPGMQMDRPHKSLARAVGPASVIQPILVPITTDLVNQIGADPNRYAYIIGPQDTLDIYVWEHPEFNSTVTQAPLSAPVPNLAASTNAAFNPMPGGYQVSSSGCIFFPLVGNVHVAGETVEQIRAQLSRLLSKYVPHPQVNVRVMGFRSQRIYIMGEVPKPGLQALNDMPMNLTDAINLAGGFDPVAADPKHIYVIRGDDYSHPYVFWLDAGSPNAMLLAEGFPLHNRDIVFVSTTDLSRIARVINQIMPSVQNAWFLASVTR